MNNWWDKSTVYQIYPLSYCDSNGDGIGDIQGIISKLDYIKNLGVDIIWLSPVYQSPMDDNGYDISDYYKINPQFGTMEDFNELLKTAHDKGLKLIMDLVVNHTSDEHAWFIEAKKSKENPYRDYYIWRDDPSEQQSVFSGSAWEFDETTEQYYFHLFSKKQPDLNWDKKEVREEIYRMINWWLDKGIDGFRLDVIDLIGKDINQNIIANGPKLHERLQEMHEKCFFGREIITVGETPCANIQIAQQISYPANHELDMIFNFQHVSLDQVQGKSKWELAPMDFRKLKTIFNDWQIGLHNEGWNSLFWCNHDQPRIVSRFGDEGVYRKKSAKMLATVIHFMQGTPFIYQGEEIGMTNVKFTNLKDYMDVESLNMYQQFSDYGWTNVEIMDSIYAKGRDNARTPMQWNNNEQAGFTKGVPWLKVNPNYQEINVSEALNDNDSILNYYKQLITLRKKMDVIVYGDFKMVFPSHSQIFAYEREYKNEKIMVICNFKAEMCNVRLPEHGNYELLISNYQNTVINDEMKLRPYESFVLKLVEKKQNDIVVKNQKFFINGKEEFIFGAELHYFRVPKALWKDRLQKIKNSGCNLVSTYIPWSFHEKNENQIDLTGNTLPEKDLKSFLELANEMEFLVLVRPGPYVMSEIKNHGLPQWLFATYPEIIAKRIDGKDHTIVSYLNDKYLELVGKWYKAVFEIITPLQITNGGNIILCQLDNEVGMFPWIMNHPDYSDFILNKFTVYLTKKFTIKEFNSLFKTEEQSISDYVFKYLKKPEKDTAIPLMNEFMLFHREYYRDYIVKLKKIAEKNGLNIPIVVNVHGFHSIDYAKRGLQYPLGLSQLLLANDIENVVLAGDYYIGNIVPDNYFDIILANAFTKAVQPIDQPLFSAEFQSGFQNGVPRLQPTTTDLKTRICFGNGMNAINYYMFVGGENYEDIGLMGRRHDWQAPIGADGSLRPHYYVIKHLTSVIKTYGKDLLNSKYDNVTHIAFEPDYFMTEYDNEFTKSLKNELQRMREEILFNGIGKALSFLNIAFDGYNMLEKTSINVKEIPSLWVFSPGYMNEFSQKKLVNYVKDGGKLIISPILPTKDLNNINCTILIDELDIEIENRKDWQMIDIENLDNISCFYTESYVVDEGFAYREATKDIVGFKKNIGLGQIVVFGAGIVSEHDYKIASYGLVTKQIGLESIVNADEWFNISVRKGENGTFLFINNLDEYEKESKFIYQNQTLFDGKSLNIPMRKGLILPIDWHVTDNVVIKYSTCEFVSKEEDLKELKLQVKAIAEEWILIETPYSIMISDGQIINIKQNQYKIILNCNYLVNIKLIK